MIQVIATSEPDKNVLIVKAPEQIQKQIEKILLVLDSPTNNKELYIKKINYIPASDLAIVISNIIRYKNSTGICVGDYNTNKLVIVEEKEKLKDLLYIINKIDQKTNITNSSFIIKLKNAKADQISKLLGELK